MSTIQNHRPAEWLFRRGWRTQPRRWLRTTRKGILGWFRNSLSCMAYLNLKPSTTTTGHLRFDMSLPTSWLSSYHFMVIVSGSRIRKILCSYARGDYCQWRQHCAQWPRNDIEKRNRWLSACYPEAYPWWGRDEAFRAGREIKPPLPVGPGLNDWIITFKGLCSLVSGFIVIEQKYRASYQSAALARKMACESRFIITKRRIHGLSCTDWNGGHQPWRNRALFPANC